jgi:hypothetical protein
MADVAQQAQYDRDRHGTTALERVGERPRREVLPSDERFVASPVNDTVHVSVSDVPEDIAFLSQLTRRRPRPTGQRERDQLAGHQAVRQVQARAGGIREFA